MIPIFMTRRGSVRSLVSVPRQDQDLHQLGVGIASAMPSLSVKGISYDYDNCPAIKSVDLDLHPGTLTALVGPNGAGKSTLLHLIQGCLRANQGTIESNGSIALMPQRASIDWSFPITVTQMVELGRLRMRNREQQLSAQQLLNQVGLNGLAARRLDRLSGGQQQRVLLARALMQQTSILLLDEPCSAIDPPTREHLLTVMRQQAESGQTLLVSSHDWGSALDSYDRVVVLDGTVLACGTPDEVRQNLTDMTCMMGSHCCG